MTGRSRYGRNDLGRLTAALVDRCKTDSGGAPDGGYAGAPCGFVLGEPPDTPTLYFPLPATPVRSETCI